MLTALKVQSKAAELYAAAKRQRVETKSYTVKSEKKPQTEIHLVIRRSLRARGMSPVTVKKPQTETPLVVRRSSRTRGMPADSKGFKWVDPAELKDGYPTKFKPSVEGLCPFAIAYDGAVSDCRLIEAIVDIAKREAHSCPGEEDTVGTWLKLECLTLKLDNVARGFPGMITSVRFFPSSSARMILVGNKFGNVGSGMLILLRMKEVGFTYTAQ
ncbi:hypothetical protein L6164_011494 [Bauhinia variegata]|uniref:Uncharacterized protein n=1 Tax=Bauhinia variegata TaxID=167791 RepID=A0ACB9P636_BAUVA|nr:hypothetical protein L6164_011494 [Bauhinia variegata]